MKIAVLITRILLGLIYVVFGFNFFLHFMPMGPTPTGKAGAFEMGLVGSGYFFQYMKVIEILGGILLLINFYTPLALLCLLPITWNIFLFHLILMPAGAPIGIVMFLIHLFLLYVYRAYYLNIFVQKATV